MLEESIEQPLYLVALDTEVFDKHKFNYQSKSFEKLIEMVHEKKIYLYLTTINQQEIISHIKRSTEEAALAFKRIYKDFRKQASIIYNSAKYKELLNTHFDKEEFYKELIEKFNNFLTESNTEILPIDSVSVEEIFDKYFNNIPPFKNGQKKHEFPDAFALAAIEEKAKDENEKIYVITGDKDWQDYISLSNHLIHIESIDKFLGYIIKEESKYKDLNLCYEILENNFIEIAKRIEYSFTSKEFVFSDYFDNGDFEVGSEEIDFITVDSIEVIEQYIIDIDDKNSENPVVTFELMVRIIYTANVSYNSTENAFWDGEDEIYYGNLRYIEGKVKQENCLPIEAIVQLSRDQSSNLQFKSIEDVILDPNQSISSIELKSDDFEVNYEAPDPYEEYEEESREDDIHANSNLNIETNIFINEINSVDF